MNPALHSTASYTSGHTCADSKDTLAVAPKKRRTSAGPSTESQTDELARENFELKMCMAEMRAEHQKELAAAFARIAELEGLG